MPDKPPEAQRASSEEEGELSMEELEAQAAEELPYRRAMSLIDSDVTIPVDPAIAADVLAGTVEEYLEAEDASPREG